MKITKPGIYTDMASADYFADPMPAASLTQSLCKTLLSRSPRHAMLESPKLNPQYAHDAGESYSSDRAIGNAAHALFLGRGKNVTIIQANDFRTKQAQETRDMVIAQGGVPILEKHFARAREMVAAAGAQLEPLFGTSINPKLGDAEVVIAWQEDGLWFRSLIDWLDKERRTVWDYKTSAMSCAPHAIAAKMLNDGFDVQAAFHARGLDVLDPDGAGRRRHLFVCQENTEPYALVVAELPESVMTMGQKKIEFAISIWRECMRAGKWPMYPAEIVRPSYPGWAEQQWLAREIAESEKPAVDLMAAG